MKFSQQLTPKIIFWKQKKGVVQFKNNKRGWFLFDGCFNYKRVFYATEGISSDFIGIANKIQKLLYTESIESIIRVCPGVLCLVFNTQSNLYLLKGPRLLLDSITTIKSFLGLLQLRGQKYWQVINCLYLYVPFSQVFLSY